MRKNVKPKYNEKSELPTNKTIDFKLILGAGTFGMGWGLGAL